MGKVKMEKIKTAEQKEEEKEEEKKKKKNNNNNNNKQQQKEGRWEGNRSSTGLADI